MSEKIIDVVKNWLSKHEANRFVVEKEATGKYIFVPVKDGVKLTDRGILLGTREAHEVLTKMSAQHAGKLKTRVVRPTHMLILHNDDKIDINIVIRGIYNVFSGIRPVHARAINEAGQTDFAILETGGLEWIQYLYQRLVEYGVPVTIEFAD